MHPGDLARGPVPSPTPGQTLVVTLAILTAPGPARMVTLASLTAHGPTKLASLRTGQGLPVARKGKGMADLHGGKTMTEDQRKADPAGVKTRRRARTHASVLTIEALTAIANEATDGAAEGARNCANRCFTRRQSCPAH